MLDILSKKMKRQLLLLELLFEGETHRFQDLEQQLKCSSKTLRNDLMDIDSYATEIKVHTERENGVFAEIAPHVTEEYIYRISFFRINRIKYVHELLRIVGTIIHFRKYITAYG
ncbi:MAG: helix-turn-helix domain-containing protein [Enterococcus lacertideformus]|uniref:Helix-turn-helix domain-containing protein n=1 Tax=Enterococcus lacertideformus TaxID=2771493 RepID=A0A931FA41_9ENTE|nr:helix-turn-helix domain-containing protein [Enterococcus lacertideformus]